MIINGRCRCTASLIPPCGSAPHHRLCPSRCHHRRPAAAAATPLALARPHRSPRLTRAGLQIGIQTPHHYGHLESIHLRHCASSNRHMRSVCTFNKGTHSSPCTAGPSAPAPCACLHVQFAIMFSVTPHLCRRRSGMTVGMSELSSALSRHKQKRASDKTQQRAACALTLALPPEEVGGTVDSKLHWVANLQHCAACSPRRVSIRHRYILVTCGLQMECADVLISACIARSASSSDRQ